MTLTNILQATHELTEAWQAVRPQLAENFVTVEEDWEAQLTGVVGEVNDGDTRQPFIQKFTPLADAAQS